MQDQSDNMKKESHQLALDLFSKSHLKQQKWKKIRSLVEDPSDNHVCLDLGSDNGVISLFLRQIGGKWHSADLTEESTKSIKSLVGDCVHKLESGRLPFSDESMNLVVVVDMLEHIENDEEFSKELLRVLLPKGRLIINTPNKLKFSLLRKLRHQIGQTDEAHGHLRPGYSKEDLLNLFSNNATCLFQETYSRFTSEFIDTIIVFVWSFLNEKKSHDARGEKHSKGLVITPQKLKKQKKLFFIYSLIYPLIKVITLIDLILPGEGFMRIALFEKNLR